MSKEYEQHLAERERVAATLVRLARVGQITGIYLTEAETADLLQAALILRQAR